jgi:hypothetical protein
MMMMIMMVNMSKGVGFNGEKRGDGAMGHLEVVVLHKYK